MANRPKNIFREHTLIHDLMEGALQGEFDGLPGWDDLESKQIAEIFGRRRDTILSTISRIKKETGYCVQYKKWQKNSEE